MPNRNRARERRRRRVVAAGWSGPGSIWGSASVSSLVVNCLPFSLQSSTPNAAEYRADIEIFTVCPDAIWRRKCRCPWRASPSRPTNVGVMARVCVVGSVNLDLSLGVEALPRPGETVLASSLTHAPGGKGGNQAVAAARAGAQVQFVGAVGDDEAAGQLRSHLEANGVGLGGAMEIPGPSGTAIVVVDANAENTIVVAPGATGRFTLTDERVRAVAADCDVMLTQLEIPVRTAVDAAQHARSAGAVVVVNASPAGRDPGSLSDLAAAADVVVTNEEEAAEWPWRPTHLVVTLGARGARYVGADGEFTVAAPAVDAV